jgi:protein-tyrosine phosphatase
MAKPRTRRVVLLSILAIALLAGARWTYWTVHLHRWTTIDPQRVYQSGVLKESVLRDKLESNGIKTVIDLRNPDDGDLDAERKIVESMGRRYVSMPTTQVPPEETVDQFVDLMEEADYPVLVHCKDGHGRSVLFAAVYRMEFEDWKPEEAWRETRLLPWFGSFSKDSGKGRYVLDYERRRHANPDGETPGPSSETPSQAGF